MQFFVGSVVVLLLGLSGGSGLEQVSNSLSLIRLERNIYSTVNGGSSLLRRKRQVSCAHECFSNELTAELEGLDVSSGSLNPEIFYDTGKLDSFCSAIENLKVCLGKCANDQMTRSGILETETFDGICFDNRAEFESFIPCYKMMAEESKTRCDPKCGKKAEMKKIQFKVQVAVGDIDRFALGGRDQNITSVLGQSCSYVFCLKSCEADIIGEKCENSSRAADFLKELGISQFEQIKKTLQSKGMSKYWPRECTKVVKKFPPAKKNGIANKCLLFLVLLSAVVSTSAHF